MMYFSFRKAFWVDMALSWGRNGKNFRGLYLCVCSRFFQRKKTINDVEKLDQKIKSDFLYTFVDWISVYIEDHSMTNRFSRLVELYHVRKGIFCLSHFRLN